MRSAFVIAVSAFFLTALMAHANTSAIVENPNEVIIGDDGLGIELRFDANGVMQSVKSTYIHPVEFPDRRGISKAYIIAEEKAKANIARFMQQVSTSSRTVTEIDDSLSKASRSVGSDGKSWQKDSTRKVIESLQEVTGSSAQAVLRGIRILEQSYDEKNEEVKVVVGMNRQSKSAASQLKEALDQTRVPSKSGSGVDFPSQPTEIRRARGADSF